MTFVCAFLRVYLIVLLARAILSWFPVSGSSGVLSQIQRVLFDVTEPVLAPLRRIIPPAGMFDISFMVVFLVILLVQDAVCAHV
jgi:YggT family protein